MSLQKVRERTRMFGEIASFKLYLHFTGAQRSGLKNKISPVKPYLPIDRLPIGNIKTKH